MSELSWQVTKLSRDILQISFSGTVGSGSEGNPDGVQMRQAMKEAIDESEPTKLLIDFEELEYRFGDWIGSAIIYGASRLGQGCVCVLAMGRTGDCLQTLWEYGNTGQLVPLFNDRDEALAFLQNQEHS